MSQGSIGPTTPVMSPNPMMGGGNTQIVDYMMANMFYSKFADMFKDGISLTPMLLVKLLLLMTVNEFKPHLGNIIGSIITGLKMLPYDKLLLVLPMITGFFRKMRLTMYLPLILRAKEIPVAPPVSIKRTYRETIEIKAEINFLMALYSYLRRKNTGELQRSLSCVTIKNAKEHIFKEVLKNIMVQCDGVQLNIDNDLVYSLNTVNESIMEVEIDGIRHGSSKVTTFAQLLPEPLGQLIKKMTRVYINNGNVKEIVKGFVPSVPRTAGYSEPDIINMLRVNHPDMDPDYSTIELTIFIGCLYFVCNQDDLPRFNTKLALHGVCIYDPHNKYTVPSGTSIGSCLRCIIWNESNYILASGLQKAEIVNMASEWIASTSTLSMSTQDKRKKDALTLSITSETPFDVNSTVKSFIDEVYTYAKRPDQTVKIFTIHLQNVVTSTEVPNPEYAAWEEKKQLFKDATSGQGNATPDQARTAESSLNDLRIQLLAEKIPPKMLTQTTSEKRIVTKQLNEITKDIDTLYLRKRDKEMLMSNLVQFRDKKEVFRTFGFQNKLNVLLYGEPGTGKSTTIQAIATYLGKDIYYLDLKEVTTNAELQMMFEYVNKNVPGSGIIILEDIDCMTDVVLRRKEKVIDASVHQLTQDQDNKLSLEYFLNILQGTLTIDGAIFLVTTNHIHHLDPAFIRPGRFDMMVELKLCDAFQINVIYHKMIGRPIPPELLSRIPENRFTPAKVLYTLKNFIFMTHLDDAEILEEFLSK